MATTRRLSARLRLETRDERARCARAPLGATLRAGAASSATVAIARFAVATIGTALDDAAASSRSSIVDAVQTAATRHLPILPRAAALPPRTPDELVAAPRLHALMISEEIALRARRDLDSLAGYVYVLSGLGLARTDLTSGDDRQNHDAPTSARRWAAFVADLDAIDPASGVADAIIDAAQEALESIERLMQSIEPGDLRGARGAALNPEAGSHAIAEDPREIRAALRAGVRTWERFPYYEWRYGRRGRRFTRSDSAWLVTLAGLPQMTVERQIAWLGRLLASRGMPRWLLEQHLGVLHDELIAAVPERRHEYARLLDAARYLRRQRTAILDDAALRGLSATFDRAVGAEWSRRLPDVGGLLAAAVCDERTGVGDAATNLAGWLMDPERFPAVWIAAVAATLASARELARPGD